MAVARFLLLLSGLALLAGCASDASWVKSGATPEQANAALQACRAEARRTDAASARREAIVSADRSGMDASRGMERSRMEMGDSISAYDRRKRVEGDTDRCMTAQGWRRDLR